MSFDTEQTLTERYRGVLAPIAGRNPVGVDVRITNVFDWFGLKDARLGDHDGRLGPAALEPKEPNWERVRNLATDALQHYTKDLQIAIWLLQALTQTSGFKGLYEGLFVTREIVHRYWNEGLYPFSEDSKDVQDERESLLQWFERELAAWINIVPLTPEINGARYSLADYMVATLNLKTLDSRYGYWKERAPNKELLLEIKRILRERRQDFFHELVESVGRVHEQIDKLELCLSGVNRPIVFRAARKSLDLCLSIFAKEGSAQDSQNQAMSSAERDAVHPETIQDPWERALGWIRLERFEMASQIVESAFMAASSERDRFFRKVDLAKTLFEMRRYDLAINVLQPLSEQIERFQLQEWESPNVVGSLWQLLFDCYQNSGEFPEKARDLESKICRTTPWISLRELLKHR